MPVVYTYCERCKAYIAIELPPNIVERQTVFPFPYSYLHGNPQHVITIYLDHDLVERGHEISDVHPENQTETGLTISETPPPRVGPIPPPRPSKTLSRRIVPEVIADLDRKRLSITEFRLLSLCDGKSTLQEIAEKLGLQFFVAMRMVLDLQKKKLVSFKKRM